MTCTFADDAFLIAAFPGVVKRTPEQWVVAVLAAAVGNYTVTISGAGFVAAALLGETTGDIRASLQASLGGQMFAAVAPVGTASLVLSALSATAGLALTVSGPAVNTIEATLVAGTGDSNATARTLWLEEAKCGLPPCCVVTCARDYTMMHAALAAHLIFEAAGIGSTGASANDFDSMTLGPATLKRGVSVSAWAQASPADADLATTGPGKMFLRIRSRYIFGVRCS